MCGAVGHIVFFMLSGFTLVVYIFGGYLIFCLFANAFYNFVNYFNLSIIYTLLFNVLYLLHYLK